LAVGTAAAYPLATEYPATLKGEQVAQHVFTIEGGMTAKCPVMIAHGEASAAEEDFDLDVEYNGTFESKCTAFGLSGTASINTNGCVYRLAPETIVGEGETTGTLGIVCPEGQKITITSGTCEVQIGEQAKVASVGFVNKAGGEGEKDDIQVDLDVEKSLGYNKTKDGSGCPLVGTGSKTDGSLSGTTTVVAMDPETKALQDLSVLAPGSLLGAGAYPATLRGVQSGSHAFVFETNVTVECAQAHFHGEITGLAPVFSLAPTYTGISHEEVTTSCLAQKIPWASVATNGCKYSLSMPSEVKEGKTTGEVDLVCPSEASIVFAWGPCEVLIGDEDGEGKPINQDLKAVTLINQPKSEPEKDRVSVVFEIKEELTYKKTKDAFSCPLDGGGWMPSEGSYTGTLILTGEKPGTEEPYDLFVES